jgi:hypothetical protein
MARPPKTGAGRRLHEAPAFRAVSIRKIDNGWVSSTATGDAHSHHTRERFHASKPKLGLDGPAPAKAAHSSKAVAKPRVTTSPGTYRDPAVKRLARSSGWDE